MNFTWQRKAYDIIYLTASSQMCLCLCVCVHYKGDKLFSVDHFSGKQPFVPLLLSPLASSYVHTSHTLSSIIVIDGCSIFIPLCIEHYTSIWAKRGKHKGTTSCEYVWRPNMIPLNTLWDLNSHHTQDYCVGNLWHFSCLSICFVSVPQSKNISGPI